MFDESTYRRRRAGGWSALWRAAVATGVLGAATFGAAALATSPAAAAETAAGTCTATLNGADAFAASSPDQAIVLQENTQADVSGSIGSGPVSYTVRMEFAGIGWDVVDGLADGSTWSDTIEVDDFTKYGVGLYKVKVTASNPAGESCNLTTYIKVEGSLLSGVAGKVGVGVLAVGGAALLGSSIAAAFGAKASAAAAKLIRFGWK